MDALLPATIPIIIALVLGALLASRNWLWVGLIGLVATATYPIAHWSLLKFIRTRFLDLSFKDEVVTATLTADLAWASIPICEVAAQQEELIFLHRGSPVRRHVGSLTEHAE